MCEIVHAYAPLAREVPSWREAMRRVGRWHERSRQRAALAELDEHLLDDIGLTHAQAAWEARKPFWRE